MARHHKLVIKKGKVWNFIRKLKTLIPERLISRYPNHEEHITDGPFWDIVLIRSTFFKLNITFYKSSKKLTKSASMRR